MIELLLSLAWSSFIWVFFFGCDMDSDLEHEPERCAPLIPVECCTSVLVVLRACLCIITHALNPVNADTTERTAPNINCSSYNLTIIAA